MVTERIATGACCAFILLFASSVISAREVTALPYEPENAYSKKTTHIVAALLEQMGLPFPDAQKKEGPSPSPKPSPDPAPAPKPKPAPENPSDAFFDDDFFEEDLSFEEMSEQMEKEYDDTVSAWDKEYAETVKRWEKARKDYLKKEKTYREKLPPVATLNRPIEAALTNTGTALAQARPPALSDMQPGDFYVIPGALDIPIRNQHNRGTCAAFAAVRGIESILLQHDIFSNFSEQHYYWLAKPECISKPCATKSNAGSNIVVGLAMALHEDSPEKRDYINVISSSYDVPNMDELVRFANQTGVIEEADCRYKPNDLASGNNETMTPLETCDFAKSGVFTRRFTLVGQDHLVNAIFANRPVVSGFRLSSNFHRSRGFVTYADRNAYWDSSKHDSGHAILLVGVIKLPERVQEGEYCLITANSWGEGWARGGYACLTEKWIASYGLEHGHVALESVALSSDFIQRNGL